MNTTAVLVISVIVAALIIAAFSKPGRQMVGGFVQRDRRGRLVLVLTPTPKKRRRRKSS